MIRRFRNFIFMRRHMAACRKLQNIVEKARNSFECEQYRRHRAAALKATRTT